MRLDRRWPRTALDAAQVAFDLLSAGTKPVVLDCRGLPGVPQRPVPVAELRVLLLDDGTPRPVRDAVWRVLVMKARQDGPTWRLVAVGMAVPGLRRVATVFAGNWRGEVGDRDAELLAGFLDRLYTVDMDRPRVAGRLIDAAERAVKAALRRAAERFEACGVEQDEERVVVGLRAAGSAPPQRPWDHPDWLLLRAVAAGVIGEEEWMLIARTRLEGCSVQSVAALLGVEAGLAAAWRRRAELQLVAAIRSGEWQHVPRPAVPRPGNPAGNRAAAARAGNRAGLVRGGLVSGRLVPAAAVPVAPRTLAEV